MSHGENRTAWWIVAAVLLTVAVLGAFDFKNAPYTGYSAPYFNRVTSVAEGGPADAAGLKSGDRILEIDGVAADDLNAMFRLHRGEIGQTRLLRVEREGESAPFEVELTLGPPTSRQRVTGIATGLMALVFLLCGLGAFTRAPNATNRLLALLGLCGMMSFTAPPYLDSAALRLLWATVSSFGFLAIPVLLIHFLLRFKSQEGVSRRLFTALYLPWAGVGLLTAWTILVQASLLAVARTVATTVVVAQVVLALGVLIRSYVKADPEERNAYGLHTLLAGFVVGIVPVLAAGFVPSLPGGRYYFFTLAAIPAALAWSALRASSQGPRSRDTGHGSRPLRTEAAQA